MRKTNENRRGEFGMENEGQVFWPSHYPHLYLYIFVIASLMKGYLWTRGEDAQDPSYVSG